MEIANCQKEGHSIAQAFFHYDYIIARGGAEAQCQQVFYQMFNPNLSAFSWASS